MAGSRVAHLRRERFAALIDPQEEARTLMAVLARVAGGWEKEDGTLCAPMTLWEVTRELDVPYVRLLRWLASDVGRWGEYEKVLRLKADAFVSECVPIADGATPETVGVAKARVEARMRVAARWDRERFGEQALGVPQPAVTINIGIRRDGETSPRVIEGEIGAKSAGS